jgi:hypothetical protein
MEKISKHLRLKEVCALIKACSEARVSELKFGELQILFAPAEMGPAKTSDANNQVLVEEALPLSMESLEIEKRAFEFDEQSIKEDRLALMAIENPSEFEAMTLAGELEDAEPQN